MKTVLIITVLFYLTTTSVNKPFESGRYFNNFTKVEMTNTSKFIPNEVKISEGETVVWTNNSDLVHTVTCDPEEAVKQKNVHLPVGAVSFNSGRLKPGQEFKYTFNKAGTYKYFCIPHEVTGMVGEIIVK